jgi:hypothetical protein
MSDPLVLPQATARSGFRHPGSSLLPVLAWNAVIGLPYYFCAFLLAYGFDDSIGWTEHGAFLAAIAVYAVFTGVLALTAAAWKYASSAFQILTFGILASLALNATAVGIGSIVSAFNKDQHSVSADFSTTTDVLAAAALLGLAAVCAVAAEDVRRPTAAG